MPNKPNQSSPLLEKTHKGIEQTNLLPNILLKVLLTRHIHAHAPIPQLRRRDLVRRARHGAHDHVRRGEALGEGKGAGAGDVVGMVEAFCSRFGAWGGG